MSLRYGLRLKIVASMVAVLAVLAAAAVLIVDQQSQTEAEARERASARQELRRLVLAFDSRIIQLGATLAGWPVGDVEPTGHGEESVPDRLRRSRLDWSVDLGAGGRLLALEELPDASGALRVQAFAQANPAAFRRFLGKVDDAAERAGCGLLFLAGQREVFCYRPLPTAGSRDPGPGVALAGRHVTDDMLEQISRQLGLKVKWAAADSDAMPLGNPIRAGIGEGIPQLTLRATTMDVDFVLNDFAGVPAGALRLTLDRTALLQLREARAQTASLLLLMILAVGIVMTVIVDQFVVRRVEALHRDLSAIVARNTWDGQVRAEGTDEIDELSQFINQVIGVVREQIVQLRGLSHSDPLTKLPNRRHFTERYADAFKLHKRNHNALSLVLFDADCFKSYNDRYGHPNGDLALITIADCLQQSARRPSDLPVRLGGEEFALLLEDTTAEAALARASAVLQALVDAGIRNEGSTVSAVLTLSGGLAEMAAGDTPESLYRRADEALYQAKTGGRNRVCVAASPGSCTSPGGAFSTDLPAS